MEAGNEIFMGDQVLPKVHCPAAKTSTIFAFDSRGSTGFQDRFVIYHGSSSYYQVCQ